MVAKISHGMRLGCALLESIAIRRGHKRFGLRYNPAMDDKELFQAGYNRVYDSLEPEVNLDHVEEVMDHILNEWSAEDIACSFQASAPFAAGRPPPSSHPFSDPAPPAPIRTEIHSSGWPANTVRWVLAPGRSE